jgi:predicted PurR-regulated permease PerM
MPIVVVVVSFVFWTWLFGPLGAIIAIPATILLRTLLDWRRDTRGLARLMTTAPASPSRPEADQRFVEPGDRGGRPA